MIWPEGRKTKGEKKCPNSNGIVAKDNSVKTREVASFGRETGEK